MKTISKNILIHAAPEIVFAQIDDFSKTGMHMSQSSMMLMGSKLKLDQLSLNSNGVGAKYRWYGSMMGLTLDFTQNITKWESPKLKEWETIGEAKIIIMSWYRMWFEISTANNETKVNLFISYLPPKEWYNKILSFLFVRLYCWWCLKKMLEDTKRSSEAQVER